MDDTWTNRRQSIRPRSKNKKKMDTIYDVGSHRRVNGNFDHTLVITKMKINIIRNLNKIGNWKRSNP